MILTCLNAYAEALLYFFKKINELFSKLIKIKLFFDCTPEFFLSIIQLNFENFTFIQIYNKKNIFCQLIISLVVS